MACRADLFADAPFFYTSQGEKEYLSIRKDLVIMKTASNVEAKALVDRSSFLSKQQAHTIGAWVQTSIDAKTTDLEDVLKLQGVVDASYGLEYADGTIQYLTDQIFIQCAEGESPEKLFTKIGIDKMPYGLLNWPANTATFIGSP